MFRKFLSSLLIGVFLFAPCFAAELTQTASSVAVVSGTPIFGTAGTGGVTAGMPVYLDTATNTYLSARANASGTAKCNGIAVTTSAAGQPIAVLSAGVVNLGATLTVGIIYCVSDATTGKIIPSADYGSGDYPVVLGISTTSSQMKIGIVVGGVAKP